jgi:hypothetical protein
MAAKSQLIFSIEPDRICVVRGGRDAAFCFEKCQELRKIKRSRDFDRSNGSVDSNQIVLETRLGAQQLFGEGQVSVDGAKTRPPRR